MEQIAELPNGKCIRKYSPEHPLFAAGTLLWASKYYQEPAETHDAFFKILSKQKPMYVCLVDGCTETFRHDDKRTRHLIQVHQYPESFSFRQRHKRPKVVSTHAKRGKDDSQQEEDAGTTKKREARKRRRQRKKERFNLGQIGDSPPQANVKAGAGIVADGEPRQQEVADVDMEELETSMSALRIPKQIRFGRKQQI
ncbi:hypothetical protein BBJ28_00024306 [Nothophytophthora sp. Chile5]|nr:hypothetical protein BBJ28_00024306 [Nothophytophthora sp. Chile5]